MEQLIAIKNNNKGTCDDGAIDIEDFVQNRHTFLAQVQARAVNL
jgi:hypothetical protein